MLNTTDQRGFTLPVILLISVGLMIVGLSMLQSTSSVRSSLEYQYHQRENALAAEAGVVYANYCLSANDFNQTWGPSNISGTARPNLTQETDCLGATVASAPDYLMQNNNKRSSFSVGNLEVRDDGAIIIASTGKIEQTRGNTTTIAQTQTGTRKQVVKWKQFIASISTSGTYKTCAIVTHELYCWGQNNGSPETLWGNLGDGTTNDSDEPRKVVQAPGVLAGKIVTDVSSAEYHSCALAVGKVYCWGMNTSGQLGQGTTTGYSTTPVQVNGALSGLTVTAIGASGKITCAIAGGKIYCWGGNQHGSAGVNSTTPVTTPTLVNTTNLGGSYVATDLSSGSRAHNMCAIVGGKAWCWGNNEAGQVGNDTTSTDIRIPTKVFDTGALAGKTVTSITHDGGYTTNSYAHMCVVADGKAYCWGEGNGGPLGVGTTADSDRPVEVDPSGVLNGKTVTDVRAGVNHTCALANARAYCWGNNAYGQLGTGNNTNSYVPIAVKVNAPTDLMYGLDITAIGGGSNRGCATAGFKAFCWGRNTEGQLGDGTLDNRNAPVESVYLRPKAPSYIF